MLAQASTAINSTIPHSHSDHSSPTARPLHSGVTSSLSVPDQEKGLAIKVIFLNRIIEIKASRDIWESNGIDALFQQTIDADKFKKMWVVRGETGSIFTCSEITTYNGQIFYVLLDQQSSCEQEWQPEWRQLFSELSVSHIATSKIKGSAFKQLWLVNQFEKRGIRAPPLLCPLVNCGKTFTRSCDLISHFNVETDTKPYICAVCNKRFRRKFMRKVHLSQHLRLKLQQKPLVPDQIKNGNALQTASEQPSQEQLKLIEQALIHLNNCETKLEHAEEDAKRIVLPLLQVLKNNLVLFALNKPEADPSAKMRLTLYALQEILKTRHSVLNL